MTARAEAAEVEAAAKVAAAEAEAASKEEAASFVTRAKVKAAEVEMEAKRRAAAEETAAKLEAEAERGRSSVVVPKSQEEAAATMQRYNRKRIERQKTNAEMGAGMPRLTQCALWSGARLQLTYTRNYVHAPLYGRANESLRLLQQVIAQASYYLLPTTSYLLLATCYLLPTTSYLLLATYYLLLATCY